MEPVPIVLSILGFLCSLICVLSWLAVVMLSRWTSLRTADRLRSRLQAWAAERGDTIVRLERPERGPVGCASLISGPPRWLFQPRDSPWDYRLLWRSLGIKVPGYSTRVVLRDRAGRLRQGRMQYIGSVFTGFWGRVESRWEDEGTPPTPGPPPADPRDDPLWDRWIDPSGAG